MKKNKLIINMFILGLGLSSVMMACDDDGNSSNKDGFAGVGSSFQESDAPESVFIPYRGSVSESDITVDGSATEGEDYTLTYGDDGITVNILQDDVSEYIETVRFQVDSKGEGMKTYTLRIVSEDAAGLDIDFSWDNEDADMDLYMWYRADAAQPWGQIAFSDPGVGRIDWTDPDGEYGFTYNYWYFFGSPGTCNLCPEWESGITATFTPAGDVTADNAATAKIFTADYTEANVNAFGAGTTAPYNTKLRGALKIEQIITKTGKNFHAFSPITVPASGSRQSVDSVIPTFGRNQ